MFEPNGDGMQVAVDLQDLVAVLQQENTELRNSVAMLKAAVLKLRRDAERPATVNGTVPETVAP